MAILSDKDREFLKNKFESELKDDVKITFFTQHESGLDVPGLECPGCRDTHQILNELAEISPRLHLETLDFLAAEEQAQDLGVDKIPAIVMQSDGGPRLRYYGMPSGYEFSTVIEDLISLSKRDPGLSEATLKRLGEVTKPTHIQVFVTPT